MVSRRDFLKITGPGVAALYAALHGKLVLRAKAEAIPDGTLDRYHFECQTDASQAFCPGK